MEEKKQIRVAVIGILLDGHKVLLDQRNKDSGKAEWELPGGHLEFGESFEECIKREFLEEAGIKVTAQKLVSVAPNKMYGNHYVILAFLVSTKSKAVVKHKEREIHLDWKWFDLDQLPENLFIAAKNALCDYKAGKIYAGE